MIGRELLLFLIAFAAGLFVLVFLGIVWMTGIWVRIADQMKREGSTGGRSRQRGFSGRSFVKNFSSNRTLRHA